MVAAKTELSAEEFVDRLLTKEAEEQPSDNVKPDELVMELPEWFDEEKFNRGRRVYNNFSFGYSTSMLAGLVAVFAVASILRVLIGSRRSNSSYTAYKRYLSTLLHVVTWFEYELKPGSVSWRSLYTVRSRHLRAGLASKMKGGGGVSQRDIALTLYGFVGFSTLKPDNFGIRQLNEGDWEAYNYVWRVIGHMIGLEERYNICRKTYHETYEVCQELQDRVYTPCLTNVPEYFEHMARVMLEGMWSTNPTLETDAFMYLVRSLADVPGYIYTENDRINLQKRLRKQLKGQPLDTGVDAKSLVREPGIDGLPDTKPRLLYYKDYESLDTVPEYKALGFTAKYKLFMMNLYKTLYSSYLGRLYFNANFKFSLFLLRYFPYLAFIRWGIKASFVNIFEEDPTDDTKPKSNSEYYKKRKTTWYKNLVNLIW